MKIREAIAGQSDIPFVALATAPLPIIVTDPRQPDNPIVYSNEAITRLTGYGEHELLGKNCRLLQGRETDRATIEQIRQALLNGGEAAVEILNYAKDGRAFWNALFISPVFDPNGDIVYFFSSQHDITGRRAALDSGERPEEAIISLIRNTGHDFNNLLTVVRSLADLVRSQLGKPERFDIEKTARAMTAILHATDRGVVLTRKLSAFASRASSDLRYSERTPGTRDAPADAGPCRPEDRATDLAGDQVV